MTSFVLVSSYISYGGAVMLSNINSTRTITSNKRALTQFFEMGPVGGPYTDAVFLNEIPCAPLIVGAPAPIPTLSQWVVICLAIMLSIIGVVYMINLSFNKTDS